MSGPGRQETAAATRRRFEAKARAELTAADRTLGARVSVKGVGDPVGRTLLVKGTPGAADAAAGVALAGADGEAASKALEALGLDPGSVWATCSRPGRGDADARPRRLELIVETVDPALILALDAQAAEDLAAALGIVSLAPGKPVGSRGRVVGSVEGLEASLADPAAKARVWRQMKAVAAGPAGARGPGT